MTFAFSLFAAFTFGGALGLFLGGWCASLKHRVLEDEIGALRRRLLGWKPGRLDAWAPEQVEACDVESTGADSAYAETRAGSYHH